MRWDEDKQTMCWDEWDQASRLAAGRKRYNKRRQFVRQYRRMRVAQLLGKYSLTDRGSQAKIARELGVSRSTVCRDPKAFWTLARTDQRCPLCGAEYR